MKISCQSCQSKYNVADEKVQGKVVKIRCRKCGSTIVVDGTASAASNGSAAQAADDRGADAGGDGQWHVNVGDNDQRSMSLAELVDAYNTGVVTPEMFIWTDGMEDWRPLAEVDVVVAALHEAAGQAASSGGSAGGAGEYGYDAGAEPAAAPAYDPAPAQSPSYGSPFAQAAAPEPAPEPRRAAVVKREARGRDLFGAGGGDDVQTSAPSMAQAQAMSRAPVEENDASKLTGERNENSVLFSLAVLTQGAETRPAQEAAAAANSKDDSGLIDLKALALKTQSSRPTAPKADGDVFSAPLGFTPAPLGSPIGVLGGVGADGEPKSKLPLYIGLGAGGAVALVLAVVIGVKIGGTNAPAPSASAFVPPPPASTEPAPSATESTAASASAAPSASVAAKPKAAGGGGAVHGGGGGGGGVAKPAAAATGGGGAAAAATPAAAVQTAAPKKNDCGCNGDLMCLMKCSTH